MGAKRKIQLMLLRVICACVLVGILTVGLWPFHAPRNEVSWLKGGNSLFFGGYGSIVSAGSFKANKSKETAPCSLEIWLQPSREYSGTMLAYYLPESRVIPFALWQSHRNLGMRRTSLDQFGHKETTEIYVHDLFHRSKSIFATISSGPAGTAIYTDGLLVKNSPSFRFSTQDLTGQLVLGNAPTGTGTWSGELKGLAVYDRELTPGEVSQHYASWTKNTQTDVAKSEGVIALYLFNEGKESVVQNQVDSATNLLIPERFFVLREQFLERPWDEYHASLRYWKDFATNIAGFIPLGFVFFAYFSAIGKIKQATWLTIALGFAVSLTIEVLQAFLPTRDSGMTDLVTNTFGTAIGAILCAWTMKHSWSLELVSRSVTSSCDSIASTDVDRRHVRDGSAPLESAREADLRNQSGPRRGSRLTGS